MDEHILKLNNRTDLATKQMLQGVIKRKKKFDQLKTKHFMAMVFTMLFGTVFAVYLYTSIVQPFSHSFSAMFTAFVSDGKNLYFLLIAIGSYGLMNVLKEKMDKAEKEFHALRCEIIDKSKDLWHTDESWDNRHLIFEMMKEKYDINLYHENK